MRIDHIGLAVAKLEDAIAQWIQVFGYRQATAIVVNTRQHVRVVFMEKEGGIPIKLIQPTEDHPRPQSVRPGMHHLCFKADALDDEVKRLQGEGLRLIAPAQPGEAFDNELIAFMFARNGLNIEIIETDKRAERLPVD